MCFINNFKKNIPLAPYTTFKIGGPAKYFFEAKNSGDLIKAVKSAKKAKVPFFILGGGSNILVSDKGFDGLVIKIQNTRLACPSGRRAGRQAKYEIQDTRILADAGALLSKLVDESMKRGLIGLEWAAGIPGTAGGAVRGNVSAFGTSMSDVVKSVEALKMTELRIKNYESGECKFEYKESAFKHNKDIILSVELGLEKGDRKESKKKIEEYLAYRDKHQPLEYPSAGCVFKNPSGQHAGYLIEQCELKGKKIGNAMISKKHANFIVNIGNAKAKDVKKLIDLCKEKVKEKFKIKLEEEIEYLGEF